MLALTHQVMSLNTCVGRITRQQAAIGGFTAYAFSSPPTSEDKNDDGFGNDDADEDNDASWPSDDEMSTLCHS